eukprot:217589_1
MASQPDELCMLDEYDDQASCCSTKVTFVNAERAQTFDCAICWEKLSNAVAVCEDHLFCEECANRLIPKNRSHFNCPTCRRKCNKNDIKRVKFIDRQIRNLLIKCPNHEITPLKSIYLHHLGTLKQKNKRDSSPSSSVRSRSRSRSRSPSASHKQEDEEAKDIEMNAIAFCDWTGKLDQLTAHLALCPFELIRCPHCTECVVRGKQDIHNTECKLYRIECSECGGSVARQDMTDHKMNVCTASLIKCGNCGAQVKRKEINTTHFNQCPEAVISCDFYQYGCDTMSVKRKDLPNHLEQNVKQHLNLMCQKTKAFEEKNIELEKEVKSVNEKLNQLHQETQHRLFNLEQLAAFNLPSYNH